MYRGHSHHPSSRGGHYDAHSRRGPGYEEDKTIELIQQFREFKPYLKKRLDSIRQAGRDLELEDEVDDIKFYLDVMNTILGDSDHGVEQLQTFIDRIHEMIRKNPIFEPPGGRRRSLDLDEEFGDEDRPRSPSPGARGSGTADNIPLIPTDGAHRTVDVNFTSRESSKSSKVDDYDEWGRLKTDGDYSRRQFKDVDMRNNLYGRGERRWSGEERDFTGARDGMARGRGMGSGMGRGGPFEPFRPEFDQTTGRGRVVHDNDHRQDFHGDRDRCRPEINHNRDREFNRPNWYKGSDHPNGNIGNDWQTKGNAEYDRRPREEDWERSPDELETERAGQLLAKHFDRRPTSETGRDKDDYLTMYQRRERERSQESGRSEASATGFGRGRREDDRHIRSRVEDGSSSPYPAHPVTPMSYTRPPPAAPNLPFGVPPRPNLYQTGLLPTPSYGMGNQPHLPHAPVGGSSFPMAGIPPPMGGIRPMSYPQAPIGAYRPGQPGLGMMPPRPPLYRIPPPTMPNFNPRVPLHTPPPRSPHNTTEQYPPFPPFSSPPAEPSPEELRDITMAKAKICFQRIPNRTSGLGAHTTPSSTVTSSASPVGPISPSNSINDHEGSSQDIDPRLNRGNKPGSSTHNHQQSPPPENRQKSTTRPDAGNVLRQSVEPRARSKIDEERRRITLSRERARQNELAARAPNKPSKLQEIRKQFEKETMFRLGRPLPKKPSGSFEDAIASCDSTETPAANKTTEKNKGKEASQSQKDKVGDEGRHQRSHSDKTEKERSSKQDKEKGKSRSASGDKGKKNDKGTKSKSQKETDDSKKSKKSSKKASRSSTSVEKDATDKANDVIKPYKMPAFKIPRKPKPVQPETPDSPEPALSQVPDADNRNNDENEPSTSTKSTSQSSSSPSNSDASLEFFKQFLRTSMPANSSEQLLSNPVAIQEMYSKLMNDISASAVKGNTSEEASSSRSSTSADVETDKTQEPEENVQQRGRSREKKRVTKRRSSLEKLHDALKEMRFDQMLPLGPRRCTRGEAVVENPEGTATSPMETEMPGQLSTQHTIDDPQEGTTKKKQPQKKRGRPAKPSPPKKVTKVTKVSKVTQRNVAETSNASGPPQVAVKGKGTKRKLKPTKLSPKKRAKKTGPVTRAQAALKKSHQLAKNPPKEVEKPPEPEPVYLPDGTLQNKTKDAPARKRRTTNMILRRLRSKRITRLDTVINRGLNKIKLESDFIPAPNVKPESDVNPLTVPEDRDMFSTFGNDNSYLADDLTEMLDDELNYEAFANLDRQTEDNVDLTVFNTLDSDEQVNQVTVTHDIDLGLGEGSTDLSYERIISESSASPSSSQAAGKAPSSTTEASAATTETTSGTSTNEPTNDSAPAPLSATNLNTDTTQQDSLPDSQISQEESLVAAAINSVLSKYLQSTINTDDTSNAPENKEAEADSAPNEVKPSIESLSLNKDSIPATTSAPPSDATSSLDELIPTDSVSSPSPSSDSQLLLTVGPLKSAISEDVKGRTEAADAVIKTEPQELEDSRKFKCESCSFSGKKIVHHYVNKHYPCHIPQARLQKATFDGLLELNVSGSPQLLEITLDNSQPQVWPCLYCENRFDCIIEFYDHLTTHTGEYRFECGECGSSYPYHKSLVNHMKQHKVASKNCLRTVFESGIKTTTKELHAFLCNDCFYFQLRFESIMRHIEESGHNPRLVRNVRLVRPSALETASTSLLNFDLNGGNSAKQMPVLLDASTTQDIVKTEGVEIEQDETGEENLMDYGAETTIPDLKENQEIFFGTDIDFAPPSVTLNECTLVVPNVFENLFLDSLLKKVEGSRSTSTSTKIKMEPIVDEEPFPCGSTTESRKRKRSDSNIDEDIIEDSSEQGSAAGSESLNDDATEDKKLFNQPTRPRVCILKKMRLRAKKKNLELNPEEPNDFFASTDESSEDSSDSDESDDDSPMAKLASVVPKKEPDFESPETLRNNEHLVKTRVFENDPEVDSYMEKRNLKVIRRAGDLHAPNTVLFGYIRPPSASSSTKLRDGKELDKLGGVFGRRPLPMKETRYLAEMLMKKKLLHLFKCMGTYCSFTTDNPVEFQTHMNVAHLPYPYIIESCARFFSLEESATLKDCDCCAYCSARYKCSKDLIQHIINQHGQSPFQCSKCFYRSFYQRYVIRHFEVEHPTDTLHMLKCPPRLVTTQTQEATLFQIFVYKCNIDNPACDKTRRFVFREDYLDHLKNCAPLQDLYPCHLCTDSVAFDNLIEHYKTHNLFKFHCSYCQFGSEVKTDLDEHFVQVHPNTSGRVFYRVKPTGPNQTRCTVASIGINPLKLAESKGSVVEEHTERAKSDEATTETEGSQNSEKDSIPNSDTSGMDDEDSDRGRVTNLKGRDLYRCVTGECSFTAEDNESFKEHVTNCSLVADSRSLACAHCERKLKTVTNLLEHMKVHGEKKQVCSICAFRCWTSTEITKHIKTIHKVMSYKLIKQDATVANTDPDVVAFPKDVFVKSLCDIESFENNYFSFAKKAIYSFENIDKLPPSKIFSADLFCSMCPYSTKVRTNIIRHLTMHKLALEDGKTVVPQAPRINPVPYLSREGLEFDKMMNLAASSHKTDGGAANSDEVCKLPQFVKEQFRYACSVCDHITTDESVLQTHIKVIHSEVSVYQCPHCQKYPESRDNPEYTVSLDKISHHLRQHGPKLYKCGHCMFVHYHLRAMEKHIPEKHPEKKPIHYLIRDVDPDGVPSNRANTSGNRRQSVEDPNVQNTEKWKCFLCSSKSVFGSWEETKTHCEAIHKANSQFMCLGCDFSTDEVLDMLTHCRENCKSEEKNKILVMFSKCEAFDADESGATAPVWKRYGGAVRHIHGNFTEDSVALIKQYNSQQNNDSVLVSPSPTRGSPAASLSSKNPMKPTASTAAKARRSVGGSISSKPCSPAKALNNVPSPSTLPKLEGFKFRCHKCDMYKTKNPSDLRVHLFNEFGYKRWKCLTCNKTFTTEKSLKGHIERDHQKVYHEDLYELQPKVPEIETEIDECIAKQTQKKDKIHSLSLEKLGQLICKHCDDDKGYTYDTFEAHLLGFHNMNLSIASTG